MLAFRDCRSPRFFAIAGGVAGRTPAARSPPGRDWTSPEDTTRPACPRAGNLEIAQTATAVNLLASRAQSSAVRQSNQDRARESLLLAIAADAQIPIDSLRAITQSMASGADGDPVVTRRHLEALDRETASLQRRIDEVEEIARLESGQVTLRMQPVSLAQLVIAVCDRLQPGAATRRCDHRSAGRLFRSARAGRSGADAARARSA